MFERMLARKYIGAQKRHSALTVCSIAIALALITMLFSIFSTVIVNLRNYAYYTKEYHIRIGVGAYWLNMEQYEAIAEAVSEYGTCTLGKDIISGEDRPFANILFDKKINSIDMFVDRIASETGIKGLNYEKNDILMILDMVDDMSRLYMAAIISLFYVFVLFLIVMLRLIIDTAFEISSKERERQFGVLQSIGATPKQIVRIITYEGLMLSVIGIPLGTAAGIGLGYLVYRAVLGTGLADLFLTRSKAAELVHFSVNPWLLLLSIVTGAAWVMFSAYGTGLRIIKMSPVQAISRRANTVKRVGRALLFGKLFGWTGKIASRNNMRQPKRFIAVVVSLTMSIALFSAVNVIVDDLQRTAEDHYAEQEDHYAMLDMQCDFDIYHFYDDPLTDMKTIEESGLFNDVPFSLYMHGDWDIPEGVNINNLESVSTRIEYLDRKSYNEQFYGAPPVSYDELAESGGYILNEQYFFAECLGSEKNISLTFYKNTHVSYSEEEYNALPPEEQEKCIPYTMRDEDGNIIYKYEYYPTFTADFDIYYSTDLKTRADLIATIDQYKNSLVTSTWADAKVYCDLADPSDYYKAVEFLEQLPISYNDNTAETRKTHALLASVNIVTDFLSIMIALIAVVNMVNILATDILNRRSELAALQCVGMTEKELRKMTVIECLQYALTSGIAAAAVCELIMFLTDKMLQIVLDLLGFLGGFISYIQPIPIIIAASLCTFIIAIAASIIPLRAMRKTSLVEQMRSVE